MNFSKTKIFGLFLTVLLLQVSVVYAQELWQRNNDSSIFYSNGNVGIGTNAPKFPLHIGNGGIQIQRTGNAPYVLFTNGTTNIAQLRGQSDGLAITNGGATTSFFNVNTNTGNVGIGTTSPKSKLEVNGDITTKSLLVNDISSQTTKSGSVQTPKICIGNDCKTAWPTSGSGSGTVTTPLILTGGMESILIVDKLNSRYAVGIGSKHVPNQGESMLFFVGETTANGKPHNTNQIAMTIKPNGDIGIGTEKPTAELEVSGTVKADKICIGKDCATNWNSQKPKTTAYTKGPTYAGTRSVSSKVFTDPIGNHTVCFLAGSRSYAEQVDGSSCEGKLVAGYCQDYSDTDSPVICNVYFDQQAKEWIIKRSKSACSVICID